MKHGSEQSRQNDKDGNLIIFKRSCSNEVFSVKQAVVQGRYSQTEQRLGLQMNVQNVRSVKNLCEAVLEHGLLASLFQRPKEQYFKHAKYLANTHGWKNA